MSTTPTTLRRSGVTLIEVLVSIFIASIGLLALLALFPLGALGMKQALKDSRCAQTAANAMALFKSLKIGLDSGLSGVTTDPFADASSAGTILGARNALASNASSYPVFVDPLGATVKSFNTLGTSSHLPAYPDIVQNNYPRIIRSGLSFVQPNPTLPNKIFADYERWFCLLDDINFDPTNPGQPGPLGGSFTRDPRYTFAYMLRRPYVGVPSTFDVTIVVYQGRSITSAMGPFEEMACNQSQFTQGSTNVIVPYGTAQLQPNRPNIKPGGWILDASMSDSAGNSNPQGYFYRVVEVVDTGSSLVLELQTPARITTGTNGMAIFLDNVAEVFEKGTISLQ